MFERVGEREEAILAWRAVLGRRPADAEAWERAHALVVATGDDGALDELLTAALEAETAGPRRVTLLLERADLRARTRRRNAARGDYRAALDLDPTNADCLRRLGALLDEDGDRAGAIEVLERLVDVGAGDDLHMVLLWLARLHEAAGGGAAAVRHLERAVAMRPGDVESRDRLVALHLALGQPAAAAAELARRVEAATGAERVTLELRLAELYLTAVDDEPAARNALVRAVERDPLNVGALSRLLPLLGAPADATLRDRLLARSAIEARVAIDRAPTASEPYAVLERVLLWRRDDDGAALAAQAAALAAGRPSAPRDGEREPTRELSAASWDVLLGVAAHGAEMEIWRAAREAANRLLGPELGQLGVDKSDRQNAKGIALAWIPADKIARSMCAGAYELYRSPLAREAARVVDGALILGSAHAERLTPAARFRVARGAVLLRDRIGPLDSIEPAELELFFAACARVAGTSLAVPSRPPEAKIEERARAIGKVLDRKERKALGALAPRFDEVTDPAAWRRAVRLAAAGAGLAVCGDLGAALAELGADLDSDEGRALARLAVSEELAALRRELGLRA